MILKITLLILGDAFFSLLAVITAAAISAAHLKQSSALKQPLLSDAIIFIGVMLISSYFIELYTRRTVFSVRAKVLLADISISLVISFFVLSTIFYMSSTETMGRRLLVLSLLSFGLFQFAWHLSYKLLINSDAITQRVLILGTGDLASVMEQIMYLKKTHYVCAGYYDMDIIGKCSASSPDVRAGQSETLVQFAKRESINKLVVSLTERRGKFPLHDLLDCKFAGIEIVDAPSFYEEVMGKLLIENTTPGWFIFSDGFKLKSWTKACKRAFDILFSLLGFLVTLPFFLLIIILIPLESRGPVFYRQVRTGEGEKTFTLYKFRTMKADAEKETGAVWALKNDKRVTRVGSILRKTRLDELPQFINVLKGEMSFIGPRPERPEFVEKLKDVIPYYAERHFVKPGITGWAQIKYRYGASEEETLEKLRYDLYYIKNLSLPLDMLILIETIKVVLFAKGAR
jgi:sugar transferase (PEP-CTERM system associated)